jgi:hypothetical protein
MREELLPDKQVYPFRLLFAVIQEAVLIIPLAVARAPRLVRCVRLLAMS